MLLVLRKLFFYLLLILYILITPSIILRALGYMIEPGEIGFYKTGLVSIITEPRNAVLYVGGKKFSHKTPTALHDLLPGRYPIRLVRKGYTTWEKEIEIYPEKATRLEPVILLPLRPAVETVSARSYRDFLPEIVDYKMTAWEGETLNTLRRIDLIFKQESPAGEKIAEGDRLKIKSVLCQEGSGLAVFETANGRNSGYHAFETGQGKFFDLHQPFQQPDRIEWDPKNSGHLYAVKGGTVTELEMRSGKLRVPLPEPVLGFGAKHNRLYFLKNDFSFVETGRAGEGLKPLFEKNEPGPAVFKGVRAEFYHIESFRRDIFQKDLFLFLGSRGELLSSWPPYQLIAGGARGFRYATAGDEEKILYWTPREIGIIYFQKESEGMFEKILSPRVIFMEGKDIRQAFWAFEDTHIIFRDGEKFFLLEAKNEAPHLVRELGTAARDSSIFYDTRSRSVFYLDPSSRHLMKRKITD